MNTQLCVVGTVATQPRLFESANKVSVCSFRIACNERRYDRTQRVWVDGETNWFSVSAFRGLAEHARDSFAVGDRVIVTGRIRVRTWESGEKSGTSVDIEADALGHDVRWGVSTFRKHRASEKSEEGGDEQSGTGSEDSSSSPIHPDEASLEDTRERWGEIPRDAVNGEGTPVSTASPGSNDTAVPATFAGAMSRDGFTPASA